jgi:hypothetical protein
LKRWWDLKVSPNGTNKLPTRTRKEVIIIGYGGGGAHLQGLYLA